MIKFGIKSAILGSAVYYTVDKGVWKDSATTRELYEELEKGMSPYVGEFKKQIPIELPPLPTNDRISYLFKYYWNCGVKTSFQFLINLPTHTSNAASAAFEKITSMTSESSSSQEQAKLKNNYN